MNRKRDRSPFASANESTKLCLICRATALDDENPDDEKSSVYAIILDPNYLQTASADADTDTITTDEDGFILNAQPTVRIDGLDDCVAFCVSKSTLYIVDSHNRSPSERSLSDRLYSDMRGEDLKIEESVRVKKTVYTFDLARSDSSSNMVVVQKSELRKLPDMLGGKVDPDAVVTPHGKILVFSRLIYNFSDSTDMVGFELYNPDTRVWNKLPPLNYNKYAVGSVTVWGSGFLSSSVYFVSTSDGGYVIDLDENERFWKKYEPLRHLSEIRNIYFIGEEGVCLTDYGLKSTRDWGTLPEYPQVSRFPEHILKAMYGTDMFSQIYRLSTLMCKVDGAGCFKFCSIQVVQRPRPIPCFILDVFHGNRDTQANKFIISNEICLKFSPKNLENLDLLFDFRFFSVQFST